LEHPDLAQISAVVAAIGTVLLIAGRGRAQVLAGLVGVGAAGVGLGIAVAGSDKLDSLTSSAGVAGVVAAGVVLLVAAALAVRQPGWVPIAVLLAGPFRPPITLDSSGGFPLEIASDGRLGRLLPLYFVLAAAGLALAWRVWHEPSHTAGAARALPRVVALPAAGFIAFVCLSLLWGEQLGVGAEELAYFTVPFALLVGVVGRSPYPDWAPRRLAQVGIGLATLFALIGLEQAATRDLFFYDDSVLTSNANSDFFRVTSLFGDPSAYGRHVVIGIAIVLVLLALTRIDVRLGIGLVAVMWAGLFFSYSQSSFVALVVVTLAIAAFTGTRRVRLAVAAGFAVVALIGAGFLTVVAVRGDSLRRETSDRTQRIEDTARVVREEPIHGVGVGSQPRASRRLSGRDRPTPNFVSHNTPLTVTAELGVIGLALYLWMLVGTARAIDGVRRLEVGFGLGLGAAFLALFVHSLFYPGVIEDPLTWLVIGLTAGYLSWPRRDDGVHIAQPTEAAPA
jgi:hypothetical protein